MKKRNLWMSLTLMCGLFSIAFTFDNNGIHWLWKETVQVAIVLSLASVIFALLWLKAASRLKAKG
jgi:hypothetical protein